MRWQSILAIYFLFWSLALFLVLPFYGRRAIHDAPDKPGHDRGAPAHFSFAQVALRVTMLSAVLFGLYYANYVNGWITAENLNIFGGPAG